MTDDENEMIKCCMEDVGLNLIDLSAALAIRIGDAERAARLIHEWDRADDFPAASGLTEEEADIEAKLRASDMMKWLALQGLGQVIAQLSADDVAEIAALDGEALQARMESLLRQHYPDGLPEPSTPDQSTVFCKVATQMLSSVPRQGSRLGH